VLQKQVDHNSKITISTILYHKTRHPKDGFNFLWVAQELAVKIQFYFLFWVEE